MMDGGVVTSFGIRDPALHSLLGTRQLVFRVWGSTCLFSVVAIAHFMASLGRKGRSR